MDAGDRAKHGCPSRGCTVCRGAMDGNERRMYTTAWMQEVERSMDARAEDVRYVVVPWMAMNDEWSAFVLRTYRHTEFISVSKSRYLKVVILNLFQYLFL
jgi:hypothetical protein